MFPSGAKLASALRAYPLTNRLWRSKVNIRHALRAIVRHPAATGLQAVGMKWNLFASWLTGGFIVQRLRAPDGRVLTPTTGQPADLNSILLDAAEEGDRALYQELIESAGLENEDYDSFADLVSRLKNSQKDSQSPFVVLDLLESRWPTALLINFEWDSIGPMSSFVQLRLLDIGDGRAYVLPLIEDAPLLAIAAVEPKGAHQAFSEFFISLLQDNGASYGVQLFGSLPSRTTNYRPDLVPVSAVARAYWLWMEWAVEEIGSTVWTDLQDTVILEATEPNPMKRSLRTLLQLPLLSDPEAIEDWLEERECEGDNLSDEERMRIFEAYLSTSYVELGH